MNKTQTNHFRMFLTAQAYLDANPGIWQSIPRLVNYKNSLDEVISRINSKAETTKLSVSVTQQKEKLKEAIATKASAIAGVLQVVATEQNNADLANAVKMTKSSFISLREPDVDASVKNIVSKANENKDTLEEFGITEDVITELTTTLDDFNALIGKPRTIQSQKYAALNNIEELFDEGNAILKLKLDNSMLIFRETQTEFYKGYQNARAIIDN